MKLAFRICSVLVIGLLLAQLVLPFFFIQQKRAAFYKEAKKRMKRELAVKIPVKALLADKNFHWEKQNKEFVYKNGMYDVACVKEENGEYVMYAVPDFAEKAFLRDVAKKDTTSDDGVFSFAPFNLFPPGEIFSFHSASVNNSRGFVYGLQCLAADQLPEDSPPKNLI